jgi:hypothetical protein
VHHNSTGKQQVLTGLDDQNRVSEVYPEADSHEQDLECAERVKKSGTAEECFRLFVIGELQRGVFFS